MEINRFGKNAGRCIWHVVINFAVINAPRLHEIVLHGFGARRAARIRERTMNPWFCVQRACVYDTQKSDGRRGMQPLFQGPLMARSSTGQRRRMEIIDESQSACLRATNTYLSEAPCNHNKTAAAAAAAAQFCVRESSIPNNQFVPV